MTLPSHALGRPKVPHAGTLAIAKHLVPWNDQGGLCCVGNMYRARQLDQIVAGPAKPLGDDVVRRLHFYNAPVTPQTGSAMNPVDWIRDLYQSGDYIVFKLDIDNDVMEGELVQ